MNNVISDDEIKSFLDMKTEKIDPEKITMSFPPEIEEYHSIANFVEYILGAPWRIQLLQDPEQTEWKGRCSSTGSRIIQLSINNIYPVTVGNCFVDLERVIRHEVIHAYIFESGIENESGETLNWSTNEMTVDWFAYQIPKIMETSKNISEKITPVFLEAYNIKKASMKSKEEDNKETQEQKD